MGRSMSGKQPERGQATRRPDDRWKPVNEGCAGGMRLECLSFQRQSIAEKFHRWQRTQGTKKANLLRVTYFVLKERLPLIAHE